MTGARRLDAMPPTHGTRDEWHVLVVRNADPDDTDVTVLHPASCPVAVSSQGGVEYECHTARDLR